MKEKLNALQSEWEKRLENAGMPSELPPEDLGERVPIGLGLKIQGLGYGISEIIDQPNDRPVEKMVLRKLD